MEEVRGLGGGEGLERDDGGLYERIWCASFVYFHRFRKQRSPAISLPFSRSKRMALCSAFTYEGPHQILMAFNWPAKNRRLFKEFDEDHSIADIIVRPAD